MQRLRGLVLLAAALCALGRPARAQFSPCSTQPNRPFVGTLYTCPSTSSHTVNHPDAVHLATNVWHTRITARRDGGPNLFDVTVDSLSAPLADPVVKGVLANATLSVGGSGFATLAPALLSSSVTPVDAQPFSSVVSQTTTVTHASVTSSASSSTYCVGSLGDLAQPPPPLPQAPGCAQGSWKVELQPATATMSDHLDDTNTHTQTDSYSTLFVSGELTTSHYEVLAVAACSKASPPPNSPPGAAYTCTSSSHHTFQDAATLSLVTDSWSTRIVGRLPGGPPLFDVTVNSTIAPNFDEDVWQAFEDARQAVVEAAGPASVVALPTLIASSSRPVTNSLLPGAIRVVELTSTLFGGSSLLSDSTVCVGDYGDLVQPPTSLPMQPCPSTSSPLFLRQALVGFGLQGYLLVDTVLDTHTHTERDVYTGIFVTGTLTTSEYDIVAQQGAASTLTIPILLSATGGSPFTSELTLTNRGTTDAQINYSYTPAFGGTSGVATDTLPAGQQRVIPDAIAYLEGLGISNPGEGGTLRATFSGLSSPDAASAIVRTTTSVPGRRAGLAYPGLPSGQLLSSPVYLCGLRQNSNDRSNAAVLNAGAAGSGDITLSLTVFSGDPGNPQSNALPDVTLSPGAFNQVSSILVSNGLSLSNGYVSVERVSGSAPFYAYGVINDNVTSDGSFVAPVAASLANPITATTLPALVETSGYSTELMLTNFSSSPHTLHFTWVAAQLTGGQATFSISLLPGEQQILPAFVQSLRDRGAVTDPPGGSLAGALFASDDSGDLRGVSIAARITTISAGGGYGVFLPAFPSGTEATTTAWLFGLQQNTETRSNLALVNTGSIDSTASTFRIDLFDGTNGAAAGSLVATVSAKGFVQINRILADYAPGATSGYALVTKISGSNPFFTYAILNDGAQPGERSDDGAFVAPTIPAP